MVLVGDGGHNDSDDGGDEYGDDSCRVNKRTYLATKC
jgi:hypothetical protein